MNIILHILCVHSLLLDLTVLAFSRGSGANSRNSKSGFIQRLPSQLRATEANPEKDDLFSKEEWIPIKRDMDQVPVFTVASKEGNPLAYEVVKDGKTYQVATIYCDIEAAKKELEQILEAKGKDSGIDLIPIPLGQAFELWGKDRAVLVPGQNAILQAGAPPGTQPIGQQVPMFACMDIMEQKEDGSGVLPLFLSLEDANAALEAAVATDGGSVDDFEVTSLSLNRAVELLATVPETPAFHFIPDSRSMEYIQEYLTE